MNLRIPATALILVAALSTTAIAGGQVSKFSAGLSGAQEVPTEVTTAASGKAQVKFDKGLSEMDVKVSLNGVADVTAAHFHCNKAGESGPVVFGLISPGPCSFDGSSIKCTLTNANLSAAPGECAGAIGFDIDNIAALAFAMRDGLVYVNIHTTASPSGELRGQMVGK